MPSSPTIGVLTFHRCINYGSYWQARCLVEGLRGLGHDAALLDHHAREVTWAEWRCALQPLLPERSSANDRRAYAAKTRGFLRAFDALPQLPAFPLDRPEQAPPVDIAVVGSDEVWNLSHPWYAARAPFWGDGLPARRLVSYAASFGNHDADRGLDGYRASRLRAFDAISVRDANSRRLVAEATGAEPALVLDPCLQFPPAIVGVQDEAPYVAVYGHGLPDWFARDVRGWASARGLRLVSIGYRNDWADEQRLEIGPEAFPGLIAGAAAVVTNFFHGCVFALLGQRPFATAPSPYRANKVRDLVATLGAGLHLVAEDGARRALDAALEAPPAPAIEARIAELRCGSRAFLDHALA